MIYFSKDLIFFPRHFGSNSDIFNVNFENLTTHKEYEFELLNTSNLNGFYLFDFSNITMDDGIYKYQLNNEVGLFQVGDFSTNNKEYNNNIEHKVYEG